MERTIDYYAELKTGDAEISGREYQITRTLREMQVASDIYENAWELAHLQILYSPLYRILFTIKSERVIGLSSIIPCCATNRPFITNVCLTTGRFCYGLLRGAPLLELESGRLIRRWNARTRSDYVDQKNQGLSHPETSAPSCLSAVVYDRVALFVNYRQKFRAFHLFPS